MLNDSDLADAADRLPVFKVPGTLGTANVLPANRSPLAVTLPTVPLPESVADPFVGDCTATGPGKVPVTSREPRATVVGPANVLVPDSSTLPPSVTVRLPVPVIAPEILPEPDRVRAWPFRSTAPVRL